MHLSVYVAISVSVQNILAINRKGKFKEEKKVEIFMSQEYESMSQEYA